MKSNKIRIVLASCFWLTTLARTAGSECPTLAKAIPICTVLADASQYDGKEITVRGLYRMVLHGSVLMSPDCRNGSVNVRQASDYKADKHALAVIRSVTKRDQFQSVEVVLRGTFRVAGKGECFGQNCLPYEFEDHELHCAAKPLPDIFRSVLTEVKTKTGIPVLLPTELPFYDIKHATVEKATAGEYAINLYYDLDAGDAGFVASFQAINNPPYSPRELRNVQEVKLADGVSGFFRPVRCGGSCAPMNLWWEQGAVLYQIQLKLTPGPPGAEPAKDDNGCRKFGYPRRSPLVAVLQLSQNPDYTQNRSLEEVAYRSFLLDFLCLVCVPGAKIVGQLRF